MKQNILGTDPRLCRKMLSRQGAFSILAAAVTLGLNLLLAALRTPENHAVFLAVNIVTDILLSWFLLFHFSTRWFPRFRLYRLTQQPRTPLQAAVEQISRETVRYMNMDCRKITANGHIFFLPEGTVELEVGKEYTFYLAANTVVEVEI